MMSVFFVNFLKINMMKFGLRAILRAQRQKEVLFVLFFVPSPHFCSTLVAKKDGNLIEKKEGILFLAIIPSKKVSATNLYVFLDKRELTCDSILSWRQ